MREWKLITLVLVASGSFLLLASARAQETSSLDPSLILLGEIEEASSRASTSSADRRDRAAAAAAFALGQSHEAKGDLDLARQYYETAQTADPGHIPITIRLAFLDFRAGLFSEALARLEAALRHTSQTAPLHSLMAFAYLQTGKSDLAEAEALRSLEADPALSANYRILASIYRERVKLDQIDELLTRALNSTIPEPSAWIRLGDTFEQILTHHPESAIARRILPFFEKAVTLDPKSAHGHLRLGEIALRSQAYDKAADAFTRALELEPKLANARQQLAYALLASDRHKEAAEALEQVLQNDAAATAVYPILIDLYQQLEDYAKAATHLETWISLNVPDPDAFTNLAHLYLLANQPDQALKAANRGIDRFPNIPHLHLLRAFALRQNKDHDASLLAFRRAETLAAGDDEFLGTFFYFELGAACELAGEYEEAQRIFQKVLAMDRDHHMAMNYLGYMWAERNINLPEAEKLIERALEFESDNPAYLDSLGWVYYQQGRYAEARTYLERALKALPEDPIILDHYGDVLHKLGEEAQAISTWEKAASFSDNPDPIRAKIEQSAKRVSLTRTPLPE